MMGTMPKFYSLEDEIKLEEAGSFAKRYEAWKE
jgi:hypothetical protein